MPELTPIVLGLLAAMLALGFIAAWIMRSSRTAREKQAITASWQEQMNAQGAEHDRLADQNKSLMEQISQYRASKKDSDLRAKELSDSLKEAFQKRDDLQRQLKEVRSNLDVAVARAEKLRSDVESGDVRNQASASVLKEKDDKIFKMSRELESWQNRLPPLIERYRLRDKEAQELEAELVTARERLAAFESQSDQTRIEPVETSPIADGLDASNDQYDDTAEEQLADELLADGDDERGAVDATFSDVAADIDVPADAEADDE